MNIILLGAPASGKGTQSEKIINEFNYFHISTGDIIRNNINNQTEYGIKCEKFVTKGELVPYSLIIDMVRDFLNNNKDKTNIIWDGFPRTIQQAKALDVLLKEMNQKIDLVFNLKVSDKVAIDRVMNRIVCTKCKRSFSLKEKLINPNHCDYDNTFLVKRSDDDASKFKTRLDIYNKENQSLLKFYQSKLIEVNSDLDKMTVWKQIKESINDYN